MELEQHPRIRTREVEKVRLTLQTLLSDTRPLPLRKGVVNQSMEFDLGCVVPAFPPTGPIALSALGRSRSGLKKSNMTLLGLEPTAFRPAARSTETITLTGPFSVRQLSAFDFRSD